MFRRVTAGVVLMLASAAHASLPLADSQGERLPSLAPMLKQVNPGVVNISTFTNRQVSNPLLNDPFFRRFFNVPDQPMRRRTQSAGSGVIIDAAKGTVITNNHVIDGADEVQVVLTDGRSIKAKVVGTDPDADIAVLDIDAKNLRAVTLADSDRVEVGDFVVAIGNPFGLGQTVTTGVVSALGRSGLGIEGYENFIQTDASINPGNSGGALVNLRGELVGINTAIIAPAGGNVGIGFAIPTNMVKNSVDQILTHGQVKRGQLGIIIQDLTPELAQAFDIGSDVNGVLIAEVQKGSAAEEGGLRAGDVVLDIEGKKLSTAAQLRNEIGLRPIGESVDVTVLRDGKRKTLQVEIGGKPEPVKTAQTESVHPFLQGATLQDGQQTRGVVVEALEFGSPASRSGLREGDVIIGANRRDVRSVDELRQAASMSSERLLLRIVRGQAALYLVIQ
jgi:Do/DeqQ family serine protease